MKRDKHWSLDDDCLEGWRAELSEFEHIWPVFESYGYTKDAAFIAWNLNMVRNRVDEVEIAVRKLNDDGDEWKFE